MCTFLFILLVTLLLLFSNTVNADAFYCNVSIFPDATNEIHAMLARDRYIHFTGWISKEELRPTQDIYYKKLNESGWTEDISYGYLKEMIVQFSSISSSGEINARVFLTSGKEKLMYVWEINYSDHTIQYKFRERFFRFKIFEDGIIVEDIYIQQDGTQSGSTSICFPYKQEFTKEDYSQIDGLLIAIDCKTTNVKKILVKVNPKS